MQDIHDEVLHEYKPNLCEDGPYVCTVRHRKSVYEVIGTFRKNIIGPKMELREPDI